MKGFVCFIVGLALSTSASAQDRVRFDLECNGTQEFLGADGKPSTREITSMISVDLVQRLAYPHGWPNVLEIYEITPIRLTIRNDTALEEWVDRRDGQWFVSSKVRPATTRGRCVVKPFSNFPQTLF